MNRVILNITLGILFMSMVATNSFATDSNTTKASNTKKITKKKKDKDEALPVIKLEIDKSSKINPKLKQGKGCEDLDELKGKTIIDYPLAKTIPCKGNECKKLKPAKLKEYKYKELPIAKTEGSCDE